MFSVHTVIPLVLRLWLADQYALCEFNCAMITVSDVLWIHAVSLLSGRACYSRISTWPEAKLSPCQENSYFITVYCIISLRRREESAIQYSLGGGDEMKWHFMLAQIQKKNEWKKKSWQGLARVWEPVTCLLTVKLFSVLHRSSMGHSLPVKRARIKTVRDKDKGDTLPLFPWEPPPPSHTMIDHNGMMCSFGPHRMCHLALLCRTSQHCVRAFAIVARQC